MFVFETPWRFLLSFLNPRSSKSAVCSSTRYEGPPPTPPLCLLVGNCSGWTGEGDEQLSFQLGSEGGGSSPSFSCFSCDDAMGGLYIFPGWSGAGHLRVAETGGEPRMWGCLQRGAAGACRGNNLLPLLQVQLERSPNYVLCRGLARVGVNRRLGVQRRMSVAESLFQSKDCVRDICSLSMSFQEWQKG